jgi:hypothetical protein
MRIVNPILLLFMVSSVLPAAPLLTLKTEVEDNKKMIVATVTRDGKPIEGIPVSFYVQRSFGKLVIGEDKTLEDGSAAIPAPEGLPGGPGGELKILAQATLPETAGGEVKASTEVAAPTTPAEPAASPAPTAPQIIDAQFTLKGEAKILQEQEHVPRALWAPHAPFLLLATVTGILVAVWGSYAFVVSQIIKIKQGAKT